MKFWKIDIGQKDVNQFQFRIYVHWPRECYPKNLQRSTRPKITPKERWNFENSTSRPGNFKTEFHPLLGMQSVRYQVSEKFLDFSRIISMKFPGFMEIIIFEWQSFLKRVHVKGRDSFLCIFRKSKIYSKHVPNLKISRYDIKFPDISRISRVS